MHKPRIMFQGTASSVGKSVLVAGLCRILYEEGYKVAPYKSQNMSLNSYITEEGKEMGRAQVMQAEACGIKPHVLMNPILIKPTGDMKAQYIIEGEVAGDMTAMDYHKFKPELKKKLKDLYKKLEESYEVIVLEGAGSPAEINLRESDLVNMGMAELIDAPVILIGDIDKGGVFASLAGTIMLLSEEERKRVKGVIINKFRGDIEILKPGLKMLEDIIHIPVLGVVPYFKLDLEDEDSVSTIFEQRPVASHETKLIIKIIRLPHLSNFTDFNRLFALEGVEVSYVDRARDLLDGDLVIIPGSKNTIEDLCFLKEEGFEEVLHELKAKGKTIFGICGGYQMLGSKLFNPSGVETSTREMDGLGLLNIHTEFATSKTMTQVKAAIVSNQGVLSTSYNQLVEGYEIHMGQTIWHGEDLIPFVEIRESLGNTETRIEGYHDQDAQVFGTYIHGIFDKLGFTLPFLRALAVKKGLSEESIQMAGANHTDYETFKESQYAQLANILRDSLDIEAIFKILFENK